MSGQDSAVSRPAVLRVSFNSNPPNTASARLTILNATEPLRLPRSFACPQPLHFGQQVFLLR